MGAARTWLRLGLVGTSVAAACKFSHGQLPGDGGGGGDVLPDAGMCAALSSQCIGDVLRVCTSVGSPAMDFPCSWGCIADDPPHCAHLVPSGSGGVETNGVLPSDVAGDGLDHITLGDGIVIDGDSGRIGTAEDPDLHHGAQAGIDKGIDFQLRGPIAMFRFKSLKITGNVALTGSRPIALVADGDITIVGVVDARGDCEGPNAGPGGYPGGNASRQSGGTPPNTNGGGEGPENASSGGGGGGHGTAGGDAEDADGGSAYGDPGITTLVGGAGGGAGGGGVNFGRGGGGGGAVQLISNSLVVLTATGGINAGGCGGKAGTGPNDSGGGGGAGGTILIEAPTVEIAGALAVNGGGGGGGGGPQARAGDPGSLDRMPANGGRGDAQDENGGQGGVGGMRPGSGGEGANPGGGGGAVGRIRINTRDGAGAMLDGATMSPGPDDQSTTFSAGSAVAK